MKTYFSKRSTEKEILDDFDPANPELEENLQELEKVNSLLGGRRVVVNGIFKIIKEKNIKPMERINILDVGCGGGDCLRELSEEFTGSEYRILAEGIDANHAAVNYAVKNSGNFSDLSFRQGLVENMEAEEFKNKIVMFNLFLHHFTDEEIIKILDKVSSSAIAILINDLERSKIAFQLFRIFARILSFSKTGLHDGKISIKKGFRKTDWQNLLEKAGINDYRIRRFWAFRHQIIIYP